MLLGLSCEEPNLQALRQTRQTHLAADMLFTFVVEVVLVDVALYFTFKSFVISTNYQK